MEDDTSNDIIAIDNEDKDSTACFNPEDKNQPIMQLFQRLLSNNNKQNTVLTNAQIIEILEKDFDMKVLEMHELEIDIYLNTVKKFLKDWPQWDEFDRVVNRLKKIKAYDSIQNILQHKYKNMKEYLSVMLEAVKPLAENTVKEVMTALAEQKGNKNNTRNIYMEVCCTRPQLNKFFYRRPCDNANRTIVNISDETQLKISLNMTTLESILNWWSVRVTINLKFFSYTRETTHKLKHKLINKANGYTEPKITLQNEMQFKIKKIGIETVTPKQICNLLDSILLVYSNRIDLYYYIEIVFNMIKNDLKELPEEVVMPAAYRKYSNKYPYVRYLYSEPPTVASSSSDAEYDLQLEEILSPMHQFSIDKVGKFEDPLPNVREWLQIECLMCKVSFAGMDLVENILSHFNSSEVHVDEPRWACTNCKCFFNMKNLAKNNWHHNC